MEDVIIETLKPLFKVLGHIEREACKYINEIEENKKVISATTMQNKDLLIKDLEDVVSDLNIILYKLDRIYLNYNKENK